MTTPRPTRVEIEADEVSVKASVLEPEIHASVGEHLLVVTTIENQADVQSEVTEVI